MIVTIRLVVEGEWYIFHFIKIDSSYSKLFKLPTNSAICHVMIFNELSRTLLLFFPWRCWHSFFFFFWIIICVSFNTKTFNSKYLHNEPKLESKRCGTQRPKKNFFIQILNHSNNNFFDYLYGKLVVPPDVHKCAKNLLLYHIYCFLFFFFSKEKQIVHGHNVILYNSKMVWNQLYGADSIQYIT